VERDLVISLVFTCHSCHLLCFDITGRTRG